MPFKILLQWDIRRVLQKVESKKTYTVARVTAERTGEVPSLVLMRVQMS